MVRIATNSDLSQSMVMDEKQSAGNGELHDHGNHTWLYCILLDWIVVIPYII